MTARLGWLDGGRRPWSLIHPDFRPKDPHPTKRDSVPRNVHLLCTTGLLLPLFPINYCLFTYSTDGGVSPPYPLSLIYRCTGSAKKVYVLVSPTPCFMSWSDKFLCLADTVWRRY